MKRMIFRAWDKSKKIMLCNHTFKSIAVTGLYGRTDLIWMLGLNVLDKCKTPIFEGDIVEVDDGDGWVVGIAQVIFINGNIQLKYTDEEDPWTQIDGRILKVIGNIYENKKLLKRGID